MIRLTFISDAGVSTKLCESTRSLAEHNIRLNGVRVLQIEDLFRAAYKSGFDRKNQRNTLSFDVWRSAAFGSAVEFSCPEEAFAWVLDHIGSNTVSGGAAGADDMGGAGTLKLELVGAGGFSATRYMHNTLLESKSLSNFSTGICLGLSYAFNGGVINETA